MDKKFENSQSIEFSGIDDLPSTCIFFYLFILYF